LRSSGGHTRRLARRSARVAICDQIFVLFDHEFFDRVGGRAQHPGAHLHGAGPLQVKHALERGCDRASHRQGAVIAQQQVVLVAEVFLDARALIVVERDAFIVVIGEVAGDELRSLVQRLQAFEATRDRNAVGGVEMQHAAGILADLMDRGVNGETRRIDAVLAFGQQITVEVDLDQAGRGDLIEHQSVRIDQEVMFRSRHAGGDVGVDEVVPAIERHQAIGGGEIDALRPFRLGHVGPNFLQARFRR